MRTYTAPWLARARRAEAAVRAHIPWFALGLMLGAGIDAVVRAAT